MAPFAMADPEIDPNKTKYFSVAYGGPFSKALTYEL